MARKRKSSPNKYFSFAGQIWKGNRRGVWYYNGNKWKRSSLYANVVQALVSNLDHISLEQAKRIKPAAFK